MRELTAEDGHTGSIWSCAWSADSKELLTTSGDSTAKIWNVADSTVATTFTFPDDGTNQHQQVGCVWHKEHIITVSLSGTVNFLDRQNPSTPLRSLQGHGTSLSALSIDTQRKVIYTSSQQGAVFKWNPETNELISMATIGDGSANVSCLGVIPSSNTVITAGFDDTVRVCASEAEGVNSAATEKSDGQPVAIATANEGHFALVTKKKMLILFHDGKKVSDVSLSFSPTGVAMASDGTEVAVSGDKKIHVYEISGNKLSEKAPLDRHADTTYCIGKNKQAIITSLFDRLPLNLLCVCVYICVFVYSILAGCQVHSYWRWPALHLCVGARNWQGKPYIS